MSTAAQAGLGQCIQDALDGSKCPPQDRQGPTPPRWTLKRLVAWVKEHFQIDCCRETVRQCLKALGFSWKKARKLLNKANPAKRAAFLTRLQGLFQELLSNDNHLLIYIDEAHIHLDTEAHIHLDTDEGYGWSIKGERCWVSSDSPGKTKVSFYGLYLYNFGEVRILPYDCANGTSTIEVFHWLRQTFPTPQLTVIWDGAPYHRSQGVQAAAKELDVNILQ